MRKSRWARRRSGVIVTRCRATPAVRSLSTSRSARGSVQGQVLKPDGTGAGGVIAFVEGVPGADDLTGPDGSFFLYGVPEGAARVGLCLRTTWSRRRR